VAIRGLTGNCPLHTQHHHPRELWSFRRGTLVRSLFFAVCCSGAWMLKLDPAQRGLIHHSIVIARFIVLPIGLQKRTGEGVTTTPGETVDS
jgi:hypothetical protein